MAGDITKTSTDGADEVIGDHWPSDSESDVAALEQHMMEWARAHDNNQKAMTDARDYAQNEMDGDFADEAANKFGYHAQVFADKQQAHLYTAGWLAMYAMAITTAKHAMNAAVEAHSPDHLAFKQFNGIIKNAKEQHDASMHTAQNAVEAAANNLENVKVQVHTAISSGLKPPMVPSLGSGQKPGDKPKTGDDKTPAGAPASAAPPTDPSAAPGGIYSPQNTNPGLTPAAPGGPSGPAAPSAPSLPASPLGAPGGGAPSAGGPAAAAPPSMPRLGDPVGGAGAGAGAPGGGSPMGGSPMGMGGMPMGGGMPMQPPQMPQMPSQTPGGDIAKTIGDTVGKLAGGQHNGQPVSAETLGKLLDAQNGGGAGGSGSGGPGAGGPGGPGDPGNGGAGGGLSDEKGLKPDGSTLAGDQKGLGKHHSLDPYSAANTNPALNDPPAPTSGPMAGPSPASPAITPTPAAGAAPITQLSADESIPPPAAAGHAGAAGATTHTSGLDAAYTDPSHTGQHGANGAPGGVQFGQQQVNSNGNALGAYPLNDAGGVAPMPAAPAQPAPMMGGGGMPMSAAGLGAAGGAAAATPPVILSTKTEASSSEGRGSSLVADPNAAATVEKVQALPPEHSIAHEHLAGVVKAFRERPGIAWTSVAAAIGVFLYDEPGLPAPRLRYILATSDALSLIPLDVKLPAGIELLGGELAPGRWLPRSFIGDWSGHQRPALKLAAAADAHAPLLGRLVYLVSNDTTEDIQPATSTSSGVIETLAPRTQLTALEATGKASAGRLSRVNVDAAQIGPDQAARYLDGFGRIWHFDDGSDDDIKLAASTLWAMRWGSDRCLQRPDDYVGTLATYWYTEGKAALAAGRLDEAAYAAWQFSRLEPTGTAVR